MKASRFAAFLIFGLALAAPGAICPGIAQSGSEEGSAVRTDEDPMILSVRLIVTQAGAVDAAAPVEPWIIEAVRAEGADGAVALTPWVEVDAEPREIHISARGGRIVVVRQIEAANANTVAFEVTGTKVGAVPARFELPLEPGARRLAALARYPRDGLWIAARMD